MKIHPLDKKSGTWRNYTLYLRLIDEKTTAIKEYLNYFKPTFNIINDRIEYITTNKKEPTYSTPKEEWNVFWIYEIDGEEQKYCIFPSELNYKEAYLNTRPEAYLCYFSPVNPLGDINVGYSEGAKY